MRAAPPAVPGDRVGVAALSSSVDAPALRAGVEALRHLGFEVRLARNVEREWEGFAGEDEERCEGFHELVADPEVRAIFFARGGHGVLRTLDRLDWRLLASQPKVFVGYSDLTPFLQAVVTRLGLISLHGPMVATDLARGLDEQEAGSLLAGLRGDVESLLPCESAEGEAVTGTLVGGCLSLLVATLGTPYAPSLSDALLFVEDVNEPFYRLDRMLTHLRLSGSLSGVKAMIFGHLEATDRTSDELRRSAALKPMCLGGVRALGWGLASGHGRPNLTLPLGARARFDPQRAELSVLPIEG